MTNKNVIVVGGAGYIGSMTAKVLAEHGYTPVVYDNMKKGHDWAVQWGPLELGDLHDQARLDCVFRKYRPEAVFHFAADIEAGESVKNPGKFYVNNVSGTISLLEAIRNTEIKEFVFSSTAAVYSPSNVDVLSETSHKSPTNPYGQSKLIVETILRDYCNSYGIKAAILRYFNAAGADPNGKIGEAHEPETHLIPLILQAAEGRRQGVTIYGDDYDTPDGTCIRDYVHVHDLATAHLLSLRFLKTVSAGVDYDFNLGNGNGYSVKEVISVAKSVTGVDFPVTISNRRRGDPAILVCDSAKARNLLGWEPEFPDLTDIVRHAWNWSKNRRICRV